MSALTTICACGAAPSGPRLPSAKRAAATSINEQPKLDVLSLSPAQVRVRLERDPADLGSVSLGRPNGGALFGGVQMADGDGWTVVDPLHAWGTEETIAFLKTAIAAVRERYPRGDGLFIGQLSHEHGGRLWPHASHQSGRDVDISYYYLPGTRGGWYQEAASNNLDRARTWTLLRAFITKTDVEHIFISRRVQRLLIEYALSIGEDETWLKSIFDHRSSHPSPLIRDAMGHTTHMHVRFFNPQAQHLGEAAHQMLTRKAQNKNHVLPPRGTPIAARRLPPRHAGVAATN